MPIDVEQFEKNGQEPSRREGSSVRPDVETFLQSNKESAYSTKEIAVEVGQNKSTVNQVLRKMAKDGLTERKQVDGVIYNRWIGE
jgi:predicted transcriptional regulator